MAQKKPTPPFAAAISRYWYLTPGVAVLGIVLVYMGVTLPLPIYASPGIWGCFIASLLLCGMAFADPRRDLVSMFTPLYAIIFFFLPGDIPLGLPLFVFFTFTIVILTIRLQWRIHKWDGDRKQTRSEDTQPEKDQY